VKHWYLKTDINISQSNGARRLKCVGGNLCKFAGYRDRGRVLEN